MTEGRRPLIRPFSRRSFLKVGAATGIGGALATGLGDFIGTASAASSAVRDENALPGASPDEWESTRSQHDHGLHAFAELRARRDGRLQDLHRLTQLAISIYRLGWYGGNGARRVAQVNPSVALPQTQPNPISKPPLAWPTAGTGPPRPPGRFRRRLSRVCTTPFSNGSTTPGQQLPDLRSAPGCRVRHPRADLRHDLAGGQRLRRRQPLQGDDRLPGFKVSYNRPINLDGALENDFFSAEYPLVRWLERNGYDVAYCTGLDVHERPLLLRNRRVFISSGHDEYVSGPQRANVEAARDAGVNMMFLTGNEYFWKTRLEPSIAPGERSQPDTVCYKESHDNAKTDPSPEWTGTWRDRRFSPPSDGGRPENALTGQLFRCIEAELRARLPARGPLRVLPAALLAQQLDRVAAAGTGRPAGSEHPRLRVGRRRRQRLPSWRPDPPLLDDSHLS